MVTTSRKEEKYCSKIVSLLCHKCKILADTTHKSTTLLYGSCGAPPLGPDLLQAKVRNFTVILVINLIYLR